MRTAADAVAATGPGPPHRVACRNIHCIGVEREVRPHHHIDNLTGSRWHATDSRPAVLIDNAQRRSLHVRDICSLLARFSSDEESNRKNGREPKNQPCCIRCFHMVVFFTRQHSGYLRVETPLTLCGSSKRNIAQASPKKASRIFLVAGNIALICATRMVTKLLRTQCGEYFTIVTDQRSATSHYQPQLHTQGLGAGVGRGRGVILGRGVGPC